mmetsp:Transcript_47816/g.152779  ORF Transcript_47816/g.152779 Transcript_47816/m.152779 type:complete len:252 (+) Transcript_47816:2088-2843(+)
MTAENQNTARLMQNGPTQRPQRRVDVLEAASNTCVGRRLADGVLLRLHVQGPQRHRAAWRKLHQRGGTHEHEVQRPRAVLTPGDLHPVHLQLTDGLQQPLPVAQRAHAEGHEVGARGGRGGEAEQRRTADGARQQNLCAVPQADAAQPLSHLGGAPRRHRGDVGRRGGARGHGGGGDGLLAAEGRGHLDVLARHHLGLGLPIEGAPGRRRGGSSARQMHVWEHRAACVPSFAHRPPRCTQVGPKPHTPPAI